MIILTDILRLNIMTMYIYSVLHLCEFIDDGLGYFRSMCFVINCSIETNKTNIKFHNCLHDKTTL